MKPYRNYLGVKIYRVKEIIPGSNLKELKNGELKPCKPEYKVFYTFSDGYKEDNIEEVWDKYGGLNFAHGAPCSTVLKREVREKNQRLDCDFGQVFGFDPSEIRRANNMIEHHPEINPIFPLIAHRYDRFKIFAELKRWGIKPPRTYEKFQNNNCMGDPDSSIGGCVQGGIGYWQLIQEEYPLKFRRMAHWERKLSIRKGEPVTVCKDQRKHRKGKRIFLEHNPMFPDVPNISEIRGRKPVVIQECNGFCGGQMDMFELEDNGKLEKLG